MTELITEYPHFFTATNLEWKKLLQPDKYKDVIIDSMKFLVKDKRVIIYGFVIMPNHIHIIWHLRAGKIREHVQRDFLKHTAQTIKDDMIINDPGGLKAYLVNAKDRKYQFWERNALSVEIWSEKVLVQKLKYIHENPVRAGLCNYPEDYKYSSALLYKTGIDNWGFLTHYRD
jgi:REP element-mobilizing transposase RayT